MGDLISGKEYKNPIGQTSKAMSYVNIEFLSEIETSGIKKVKLREGAILPFVKENSSANATNGKIGG